VFYEILTWLRWSVEPTISHSVVAIATWRQYRPIFVRLRPKSRARRQSFCDVVFFLVRNHPRILGSTASSVDFELFLGSIASPIDAEIIPGSIASPVDFVVKHDHHSDSSVGSVLVVDSNRPSGVSRPTDHAFSASAVSRAKASQRNSCASGVFWMPNSGPHHVV
jgi:hypothetical protein